MPSIFRNLVCRSSWNHLKFGSAVHGVIDGSFIVFRIQSIYSVPILSNRTAKRRSQRNSSPHASFFPSVAFFSPNRRSFFLFHFHSPALLHHSLQTSPSIPRRRSDLCLPNRARLRSSVDLRVDRQGRSASPQECSLSCAEKEHSNREIAVSAVDVRFWIESSCPSVLLPYLYHRYVDRKS